MLQPCRWVHTVGMRFAIDVAYVDHDGAVVKTVQMRRRRVGVPVFASAMVVEAAAGAFSRWGLRVGDVIELRGDEAPATERPVDQRQRPEHGDHPRVAVSAAPQ